MALLVPRIVIVSILVLSMAPHALAEEPYDKLGRGLSNLAFGWADFFVTLHKRCNDRGYLVGPVSAVPEGIYRAFCRTVVGFYETATYLDADNSEPIITPEYVLDYELSDKNIDIEAKSPTEKVKEKRREKIVEGLNRKNAAENEKTLPEHKGVDMSTPELKNNIAASYYKAKKAFSETEKKETEAKQREFITQTNSKINKLFKLAEEAEKRRDHKKAEEFYKKILKLTADAKIKRIIEEQRYGWIREAKKKEKEEREAKFKEKREHKSIEKVIEAKVAERIEKEKTVENENTQEDIVVRVEPPIESPGLQEAHSEKYYLKDFSKKADEDKRLIAQGDKLLEEKKFREAYKVFKKTIEDAE